MFTTWLVATYSAVLVSELIGDKSLVSVSAFATRYAVSTVTVGLALGFAAKSFVAVVLGRTLGQLSVHALAVVTAFAFYVSALVIWYRPYRQIEGATGGSRVGRTIAVFSSVFFTEWADVGQLATASFAARSPTLGAVWVGATLALCTKGVAAVSLGRVVGNVLPERAVRRAGATVCLAMGLAATIQAAT